MSRPPLPRRVALASGATLPMMFEAPHAAFAATLESALGEDHDALHDPKAVIRRLADLGLLALLVPVDAGGHDAGQPPARLSVRSLCLARESIGYWSGTADSIFAVQGLGSHPVVLTPSFPDRARFLSEVVGGAITCAFALTEPEAGSDVASLRSTARADGDDYVLDGEKTFISNAGLATHYAVFANANPAAGKKGISAFLVPASTPGLRTVAQRAGGDHPLGRVVLEGCRVPKRALIGEVGQGLRLALATLDVFRTSVGAAAVGMARRAFDEAVAFAKSRRQFGARLADFQLTQGALAEMTADLEGARLLVYRAAWEKDRGATDGRIHVAIAKLTATEAAFRIIDRAVQLLGGRGVLEGGTVERLYREVRPLRIYEGTSEIQKLIVGAALTADVF